MNSDHIARLTNNQRAYLRLVLAHRSSKEIAQIFDISAHTVDKRIKEAMRVLGVSSRIEAAKILGSVEDQYPPPKLGAQSSDLALPSDFHARATLGTDGDNGNAARPHIAMREDALEYGTPPRARPRIALPYPLFTHPDHNLSILQRAGWMIGLIIGLALATGIMLSGLSALSALLMSLRQ